MKTKFMGIGFMVVLLVSILLLFGTVDAQEISVTSEQDTYYPGDEVTLFVTIKNVETDQDLVLEASVAHMDGVAPPLAIMSPVSVSSGVEKTVDIDLFSILNTTHAGIYNTTAMLWDGEMVVDQANILFEVAGTFKIIDLKLLVCLDSECEQHGTIFHKGDHVYLNYESEVSGLSVNATIMLPDENEREMILPTDFTLEHAGLYQINTVASKEGYMSETTDIEIGVLAKEITVIDNGLEGTREVVNPYLVIGVIATIVILSTVLLLRFLKKKRL